MICGCISAKTGPFPLQSRRITPYQPLPYCFPTAIWGDACTMVPWAVYRAYGNVDRLAEQYESMKAYTGAEVRAAARTGFGKRKFLWDKNPFQYGDWCAPGEGFYQWKKKGKYLSTAFFANSVNIMRQAAHELGKEADEAYYTQLLTNIKDACATLCLREDGKLIGDFQSNYVCALYFDLISEKQKPAAAKRLVELVRGNDYKIATGFAGTPYLCFALADNGYVEDAYKVLQNEKCPGWLHTVKAGGTTTWERWDALDENGHFYKGSGADMVSFNHYAYGAVGAFFYRRILGIEPVTAGYEAFRIRPIPGGTLRYAQGSLETKHGRIEVKWERGNGVFSLQITVPVHTRCTVTLLDGSVHSVGGGKHEYTISEGKKHE